MRRTHSVLLLGMVMIASWVLGGCTNADTGGPEPTPVRARTPEPVQTKAQAITSACTTNTVGLACTPSNGTGVECGGFCYFDSAGSPACLAVGDSLLPLAWTSTDGLPCGADVDGCDHHCSSGACVAGNATNGAACRPTTNGTGCDGRCNGGGSCAALGSPCAYGRGTGTNNCKFNACHPDDGSACEAYNLPPNIACTADSNPCTLDVCGSGSGLGQCTHPAGNQGTPCRAAAPGGCDIAENCDGTSTDCPADAKRPSTYECRAAAAGGCDVAELCDGSSNDCPADAKRPSTYECRAAAAGGCDVAELCDGSSNDCPTDAKRSSTYECRAAAAGGCDVAELCDGSSNLCPSDAKRPSTFVCRTAAGNCDAQEFCPGNSNLCPADVKRATTYECRAAAAGGCDVAELCDGTDFCPADAKRPSTYECRAAAAGGCDVAELCDGSSNLCPTDSKRPSTYVCRIAAAGGCDVPEFCDGSNNACPADAKRPSTYECRAAAAGGCDVAEFCDGTTNLCPTDAKRPSTYVCRAANGDCDVAENCPGSADECPVDGFRAATVQCRPASCADGIGTLAANCTGTSATCPAIQTEDCTPYFCQNATQCAKTCAGNANCEPPSYYCEATHCVLRKVNGTLCANDNDYSCQSNFCVDGYCCDKACAGQCEACDVQASQGICQNIIGAPHGTRPACEHDGTSCDGACDGTLVTACAYPGNTVQCRTASCANDVAVLSASCNGSGHCPTITTQPCTPFKCSGTQCGGNCTTDPDCASGSYCSGGICLVKHDPGFACTAPNMCKSGYCVDGYCCNAPCNGQCQACDITGLVGTCSPVPNPGAPHGTRPACATDGTSCGGYCNGTVTATCFYPVAQCRPPSCANEVATLGANCDGMGACPGLQTQICAPFKCNATNTACGGGCTIDTDCAGGSYCSGGVCHAKLAIGYSCGGDNQCTSGYCVDSVCCGGGCVSQCEACDVSGQEGTCVAVTGAPHGARTPCGNDGSLCSGACDGTNTAGCHYPDATVQCRAASCTNNVAVLSETCTGDGFCPPAQPIPCAPFTCNATGTACGGNCTTDPECAQGHYCAAGVCQPKLDNGQTCSTANQCNSAVCEDGYCCNASCPGQCQACDVPTLLGICSAVVGAPHNGKAACAGVGQCQAQCDGISTNSCVFPTTTDECAPASCANGVQTAVSYCDGAGTCVQGATKPCGAFGCGDTECKTSCSSPADCQPGAQCVGNVCVLSDAGADAVPPSDAKLDSPSDVRKDGIATDGSYDATVDQGTAGNAPSAISTDEGGCGCKVAGTETGGRYGLVLLVGAVGLMVARRRRDRS